ncbi:hypothetical protein TWF192_011078 [Orbilia oligospora]|nr:hypothetical protein TWF192_011078 [Orbilia oligospora]
MSVLAPYSFSSCNGMSDILDVSRRSQMISRIQSLKRMGKDGNKKARQERNTLYQNNLSKLNLKTKIGEDTFQKLQSNPRLLGFPRSFKLKLAGVDSLKGGSMKPAHDGWSSEEHTIFFSAFGTPGKPIRFDNGWISPEDITLSPDKNFYNIVTTDTNGQQLGMYLDFMDPISPQGSLSTPNGMYHLSLQPYATQFNVSISANAGAYSSTAKGELKWDETSAAWQNAQWNPNSMVFAYDTVKVSMGAGMPTDLVNEFSFEDPQDPNNPFQLTAANMNEYTSTVDGTLSEGYVYMAVNVNDAMYVPNPIPARATQNITSVYPIQANFKFDDFGLNFTGAYMVPNSTNTVYAVTGVGIMGNTPEGLDKTQGMNQQPTTTTDGTGAADAVQPDGSVMDNVFATENNFDGVDKKSLPKPSFSTLVKPITTAFRPQVLANASGSDTPTTPLIINGLLGMNPMQPATAANPSPTGYYDAVAEESNQDFHDIVCYYMDDSIRTTFVQSGPYVIEDQTVLSIANDSAQNEAFYKQLQVPYVTASLAGATSVDDSVYCNGKRAQKQLQDLPANSPIYKRHVDALYRYRFIQRFSTIQSYINDQSTTDYTADMAAAAAQMKTSLAQRAGQLADPKALASAQEDIDNLLQWATDNKLYWAFALYEYCIDFFIPMLYAQTAAGRESSVVSMNLKSMSSTFGMLEGSNNQTNPNGKTFEQAFNELLRSFQMTMIVPQLVDLGVNKSDYDSIFKAVLQQFYTDNINSQDPNIVKEAVLAQEIAANEAATKGFLDNIVSATRLATALSSWAYIFKFYGDFNEASKWWTGLANSADATAFTTAIFCAIMLTTCNLGNLWKTMTTAQKAAFVATAAGTTLVIMTKVLQGVVRLAYFWSDFSGFWNTLKVLFGVEKVFAPMPGASSKNVNALTEWLLRTREEAMSIEGERLTVWNKIFGRNAGEFLANFVGVILAGICLVLSAMDAAKSTDPLQKAMDIVMAISSGLQILAIATGWLLSVGFFAEESVAIATTVASCLGAAAAVLAVVGLVIMIVMFALHRNPPNPVDNFIDTYASPAGLKMPYKTEIDYLDQVPADKNTISLMGVDFGGRASSGSPSVAELQLGAANSNGTYGIQTCATVTQLPDTCWSVKTDSTGITRVFTSISNATELLEYVYLAVLDDGSVGFAPSPAKYTIDSNGKEVPVDPAAYEAQLKQQQWQIVCQAEGSVTTRTFGGESKSYTLSAYFSIQNNSTPLCLQLTASGGYQVVLGDSSALDLAGWQLTQQAIGPPQFSYVQKSWELSTVDTDEADQPMFDGSGSSPLTWSISPPLPSWLQFDTSTGIISQASGVTAPVFASQSFNVEASLAIASQTFTQYATVTISVTEPPASVTPPPTPST